MADQCNLLNGVHVRVAELVAEGYHEGVAFQTAFLERQIQQWPTAWADNLEVLVYGDFSAPTAPLAFPTLGVTILPEPVSGSVIKTRTVLKAIVAVPSKSVDGLFDASGRINRVLGILNFQSWGNGHIGWWSLITHGGGAGVGYGLEFDATPLHISRAASLPDSVRLHFDAALLAARGARRPLFEFTTEFPQVHAYLAWWDAFESFVRAWNSLAPQPSIDEKEARRLIAASIAEGGGTMSPSRLRELYQQLNPSFPQLARRALGACYGLEAPHYISECFSKPAKSERLYQIRNRLKHGSANITDPLELMLIEARLHKLWLLVWGMYRRLLGVGGPVDEEAKASVIG